LLKTAWRIWAKSLGEKKLTSCIDQGYNVILVLNGEEIDARSLD